MKQTLVFIAIHLCDVLSDVQNADDNRRTMLDHLTKTRTVLLDDYQLISRQISNIYPYTSYQTVSVILYQIKNDLINAHFTFQAEEIHLNHIGSCEKQDVIVNLKHGSYAAVNPDGYDFPKNFIDPDSREAVHTIEMLSDGSNITYSIKNPTPGNWFALIYLKWQDPRSQKVEQQGLVADCETVLYTYLQTKSYEGIKSVDCYKQIDLDYSEIPMNLKCISSDAVEPINLRLKLNGFSNDTTLSIKVGSSAVPTEESSIVHCTLTKNITVHTIMFMPNINSWHYITIEELKYDYKNVSSCEVYNPTSTRQSIANESVVSLMRDDKGKFFTFDYGLPTADLQDVTSLVNLSSYETKILHFDINPFLDMGGSLSIEASLLMKAKYYMGYRREKVNDSYVFTEQSPYFMVVVCMDIGHASTPLSNGRCKFNDKIKNALFVLNSTDSETIYDKIIIPYPESGVWYLSMKLFCDSTVCPCPTSDNSTKYYVHTNSSVNRSQNIEEEMRIGNLNCNTTVVLAVSSTSCVGGKCQNEGVCSLNIYGGLVTSFCSCPTGYGAWDCSDSSRMDSRADMISSVLLLVLSNLAFLFSIYVAIIRLYYAEALTYTFAMTLSMFYHACDAHEKIAYCIVRGNVLQYGDFYCGLLSFWVTLLAMTTIGDEYASLLRLLGAIVIALLTAWSMRSFLAFALPVAVGACLVLLSWYLDYRTHRSFRLPRTYYKSHLPVGALLVVAGLTCYAFLQTERNYKVVHSLWHVVIAVSVAFMLPDSRRTDGNSSPFLPSARKLNFSFCKFLRRTERI